MLDFQEGGKPENTEKNPLEQGENQQQTQPTYGIGPESNPRYVDGRRRALSPQRRPCSVLQKQGARLLAKLKVTRQVNRQMTSSLRFLIITFSHRTRNLV